jgi:hypothetical protein
MSLLRAGDFLFSLRFLRLLTTKWENTGAFKAGIIDRNGNIIRKSESSEDKKVYNSFHRIVFNIKRLINKVPIIGKSTLASYASALWLIKEHTGMSDKSLKRVLSEVADFDFYSNESGRWNLNENNTLRPGIYKLMNDISHPYTGEIRYKRGDRIKITEYHITEVGRVFNYPIFQGLHLITDQKIFVSQADIKLETMTVAAVQGVAKPLNKKLIKRKELGMDENFLGYWAIVLTKQSTKQLLNLLDIEISQDITDWKKYAHHMTVVYNKPLPENLEKYIGKSISLLVSHIGSSEKAVAVKVNGFFSDNELSHITLATSPKGKPVDSNKITDWKKIKTIEIEGTLEHVK